MLRFTIVFPQLYLATKPRPPKKYPAVFKEIPRAVHTEQLTQCPSYKHPHLNLVTKAGLREGGHISLHVTLTGQVTGFCASSLSLVTKEQSKILLVGLWETIHAAQDWLWSSCRTWVFLLTEKNSTSNDFLGRNMDLSTNYECVHFKMYFFVGATGQWLGLSTALAENPSSVLSTNITHVRWLTRPVP